MRLTAAMPYRNDLDALQERLAQLEQRLDAVRARRVALESAAREEPDLVRDLDRVRRELAARTRLPLLGEVRVASPCDAAWDAMAGDDRVRHCGKCEKKVYNLSAMTGEQAEALLAAQEGRVCVRFYRRADGTVLTADCPTGVRRRRIKVLAGVGAGLALATAGASLAFVHKNAPASRPTATRVAPPQVEAPIQGAISPMDLDPPHVVMGQAVAPTPPQPPTRHPPRGGFTTGHTARPR